MAARGGESKQGLVVTLVFFVLATIGLGVTSYYGFQEQEKLRADLKKAQDEKGTADKDRDYFRFQAAYLRSAVGSPPPADSALARALDQKAAFDGGQLGASSPDFAQMKELSTRLDQVLGWNAASKAPTKAYDALLRERINANTELSAQLIATKAEKDAALAAQTKAEADLKKAKDEYASNLSNAVATFKSDRDNFAKNISDLTTELNKIRDTKDPETLAAVDDKVKLEKEKRSLERKLRETEEKLAFLQARLDSQAELRSAEAGDLKPRGEIVRIVSNLRRATINLGKADNLTVGTTFAVHGVGPGGRPLSRAKANIEVVSVGERSSEVVFTGVFSPDPRFNQPGEPRKTIDVLSNDNTDPVIRGDLLVNPLWNPGSKTHIAVAGHLNLGLTGAVNVDSLLRQLEKQNIIVDAYVDPTDGVIKGPGLTRRTDFLILADSFTGAEPGVSRDEAVLKLANDNIRKLVDEAKGNAVTLMSSRRFLQETGFYLPRNLVRE